MEAVLGVVLSLGSLWKLLRKPGVVVHADEVDIHLDPKTGPDGMLPGTQGRVLMPGDTGPCHLAGACQPSDDGLIHVERDLRASAP